SGLIEHRRPGHLHGHPGQFPRFRHGGQRSLGDRRRPGRLQLQPGERDGQQLFPDQYLRRTVDVLLRAGRIHLPAGCRCDAQQRRRLPHRRLVLRRRPEHGGGGREHLPGPLHFQGARPLSARRQAMFRNRLTTLLLLALCSVLCIQSGYAQTASSSVQEDFTGAATTNNWYFFNGACLTASSNSSSSSPGSPPGCIAIDSSYYSGEPLVGGYNGSTGPTVTLPDSAGFGALRFTNGCTKEGGNSCGNTSTATGAATNTHTYGGGHHQNGAIISQNAF